MGLVRTWLTVEFTFGDNACHRRKTAATSIKMKTPVVNRPAVTRVIRRINPEDVAHRLLILVVLGAFVRSLSFTELVGSTYIDSIVAPIKHKPVSLHLNSFYRDYDSTVFVLFESARCAHVGLVCLLGNRAGGATTKHNCSSTAPWGTLLVLSGC